MVVKTFRCETHQRLFCCEAAPVAEPVPRLHDAIAILLEQACPRCGQVPGENAYTCPGRAVTPGIGQEIGRVLESLVEAIPAGERDRFADRLAEGLTATDGRVPADLIDRWLLDVLADPTYGVRRASAEDSPERAAIDTVVVLLTRRLAGDPLAAQEWHAAALAALAVGSNASAAAADTARIYDPRDTSPIGRRAVAIAYRAATTLPGSRFAHLFTPDEIRAWQAHRFLEHMRNSADTGSAPGATHTR